HPERAITSCVQWYPLISILAHLAKIGRKDHRLRSVLSRLSKEMAVWRTRHIKTSPHVCNHFRVVPVGAFANICLFTPYFRESRREIAVPIIKTEVHATEQLEEPAAGCVTQHRHGWNRRETHHTIG